MISMFMQLVYQIVINVINYLLPISKLFSSKMNLFVSGRKDIFSKLRTDIQQGEKYIWMHVASLGEYEQGVPVLEALKLKYPEYKILLTFFSPSGYEIRKNNSLADFTYYLPIDTKTNSRIFLDIVQPKIALFIKYEFWPNYLFELKRRNIPTYLISGIFRPNQLFFKWYGGFYRKSLDTFWHFFVQNQESKDLLKQIGKQNCTIHGDTRFDRVIQIAQNSEPLEFIERFIGDKKTIVIGSSWEDDEEIYLSYIHKSNDVKFIIAPHNILEQEIEKLRNKIQKKVVCYTEMNDKKLEDADVFIVDTIGLLSKIYKYAYISHVGGGYKTGLHNVLEPAVFGVPVLIGPNYRKFKEACDLVSLGGCIVIQDANEWEERVEELLHNNHLQNKIGEINKEYILKNKFATKIVVDEINKILK